MTTVRHEGGMDVVARRAAGLMMQWTYLSDGSHPRLEVTIGSQSVMLRPQEVEQMRAYLKWSK